MRRPWMRAFPRSLTEIGTLNLWCEQIDGSRRWQLQFDVRSATETDREAHTGAAEQSGIVDQELVSGAVTVLRECFREPRARFDPKTR
jgi:hypothetical protein